MPTSPIKNLQFLEIQSGHYNSTQCLTSIPAEYVAMSPEIRSIITQSSLHQSIVNVVADSTSIHRISQSRYPPSPTMEE